MPKSVLIISYFFPPVGGAGVQRVTKFVKYLGEFGWEPLVLTTKNPSVPLFDETLLKDIPETVRVYKARTLEPGYAAKQAVSAATDPGRKSKSIKVFLKGLLRKVANSLLQPDPQILWLPSAIRLGNTIIKEQKPTAIFVSAPPFSSLLIAAFLARKSGIPLVLDYRDEWDISNSVWENKRMGKISLAAQRMMQNYAIRSASALVATTSLSTEALSSKTKLLEVVEKIDVRCIYNGFDATDFPNVHEHEHEHERISDKFVISYVGTLWNLTSIEPLIMAIQQLSESEQELAENLELVVAGRRTAEQEEVLCSMANTAATLTIHDYLDHSSAIDLIRRSDCLILLLSNMDVASRVVPGKLFEYFATTNPILAIAPEGEVWKLMDDYPESLCADPTDIAAISNFLEMQLRRYVTNPKKISVDFDAGKYERKSLTNQLANLLNDLVD